MSDVNNNQEWRYVEGVVGYQVSNCGQIRSRWKKGGDVRSGSSLGNTWRILKCSKHKHGYRLLHMKVGSAIIATWVHRIVAVAFHGTPPTDKTEVRHIDGNPENNRANNLKWGTHLENMRDIDRHGRRKRGETLSQTKVTNAQAIEIVRRASAGELQKHLAIEFGVAPVTISRMVRGVKWSMITGVKKAV